MRILHAPANVANQSWAIAQGLRALGHEAEVWHYNQNPFGYPCDRNPPFPPGTAQDLYGLITEAIERFDILHFHFGRSLVQRAFKELPALWDLPLYRAANKPVFFTFHGTDVRLKSKHMAENTWSYYRFADMPCDEEQITARLQVIRTYANGLFVASPINLPYVPDATVHPLAIELDAWPYVGPANRDVPLVVHVSSRRATKGTDFALRAVEKARADGLKFDFRLVENVSNDEVRRILSEADVVIHNLLFGDYEMTGVEAMALGKVVITRLDESVTQRYGSLPVQNADPDTVADVLERVLGDADLRAVLGEEGRRFVERTHDAKVVAAQLLRSYEDPPETFAPSWPDWPPLGDMRRKEFMDRQIVELTSALRAQGKQVSMMPVGRGFARIGARIDALLRTLYYRVRKRR